jgi:hypothetical protein
VDRTVSWLASEHTLHSIERTLAEVDAAIALVVLGAAVTVRLCNLAVAEDAAFVAAARAQDAGVEFSLFRDGSRWPTLVVGPRRLGVVDAPATSDPEPVGNNGDPA